MWIQDGKKSDPGWKKVGSRIRNKHHGSATLPEIGIIGQTSVRTFFATGFQIEILISNFLKAYDYDITKDNMNP
jgi:hypothetical protein